MMKIGKKFSVILTGLLITSVLTNHTVCEAKKNKKGRTSGKDSTISGQALAGIQTAAASIDLGTTATTKKKNKNKKKNDEGVQSRIVAEKDAPTFVHDLTKRVGAAKGKILDDAQAGLSSTSKEQAIVAARDAFFEDLKSVFERDGLKQSDTGYKRSRYKLKLLLTLLVSLATKDDLADIRTVILSNPDASEFKDNMVSKYAANDFLNPDDKAQVQEWLLAGWGGDALYFAPENCAK